jgi:pimeloyl-ACP methyl ester carboxylesterase
VGFSGGVVGNDDKGYNDYVRCVRGGQSGSLGSLGIYSLSETKGGPLPSNTSLLSSVNGDNDYLSSKELEEITSKPNTVTHALYPVEFYTQKTSDNSCAISANGTPEPLNDTRQPLILIHGWQGSNDMNYPSVLCKDENLGETYWNNFIQYFKASPTLREKYRLYVYHYSSYKHVTFNARVLSRMLQGNAYIKSWIANNGKISILAHSMGGLVSRSLLEEHLSGEDVDHTYQYILPDNSTANKTGLEILDKLVTVATPHHGSPAAVYWWAYNAPNWLGSKAWVAKDLFTPGAQDLFWDNYDGVFAWVFTNNRVLDVNPISWDGEGYVSAANSGRLSSSTGFDQYYRSELLKIRDDAASHEYRGHSSSSGQDYTIYRYSNPWLSKLNDKFKQNKSQYSNKYIFLSGYNDGNNSSAANRLSDTLFGEVADDVVYSQGYVNDWAVPLTSGSLDFSKEATGLGAFELNPSLFTYSVGGDAKSALFNDFLNNNLAVIYSSTVNGIPVRILKDYHHDRMLNGGYKSSSSDLLDSAADSGFNDGGGRTLYLDQAGFKHPGYISRTFPSKLMYEPVFQVVRSFLAPVYYRDIVQNGGFENGGASWNQSTAGLITNAGSNQGNNGSAWYASLGGGTNTTSAISQDISVPANVLSAKLSFAYKTVTYNNGLSYNYNMSVQVANPATGAVLQTLKTLVYSYDSESWLSTDEFDLSAYKGQTVRVSFSTGPTTTPYYPATFLIDDVRLITTEQAGLPKTLSVSLNGTGSGNVTAIPYSLSCILGSCGLTLDYGTDISLAATASTGSTFTGWSGDCLGTGNCNLTLDADKSVTATFNVQNNVKNSSKYYGTLQNACDDAATGNTVQAKAMEFLGNLFINKGVSFTLRGGYDSNFSTQTGSTTVDGVLTIGTGSIIADRIVVK